MSGLPRLAAPLGWFLLFLAGIAYPLTHPSNYGLSTAITALMFVVLAVAYDLVVGRMGALSFAQPVFFGFGAYAAALLTTRLGLSFWPEFGVGVRRRRGRGADHRHSLVPAVAAFLRDRHARLHGDHAARCAELGGPDRRPALRHGHSAPGHCLPRRPVQGADPDPAILCRLRPGRGDHRRRAAVRPEPPRTRHARRARRCDPRRLPGPLADAAPPDRLLALSGAVRAGGPVQRTFPERGLPQFHQHGHDGLASGDRLRRRPRQPARGGDGGPRVQRRAAAPERGG